MADRTVPCPACKAPTLYGPANRWRPFCSARCRGVDLGAWANENYRVAGAAPTDGEEETSAPPSSGPH